MNREIIKISEYEEEENAYDWEKFEVMQETTLYTDLREGITSVEMIIRRIKDGKFFKFEYTATSSYSNELEQEAEEVFRKTRISETTYYE